MKRPLDVAKHGYYSDKPEKNDNKIDMLVREVVSLQDTIVKKKNSGKNFNE